MSPLDYCVNNYVEVRAREIPPEIGSPDMARAAAKRAVREMPRKLAEDAIDHFVKRLEVCVAQGGGHIEHVI